MTHQEIVNMEHQYKAICKLKAVWHVAWSVYRTYEIIWYVATRPTFMEKKWKESWMQTEHIHNVLKVCRAYIRHIAGHKMLTKMLTKHSKHVQYVIPSPEACLICQIYNKSKLFNEWLISLNNENHAYGKRFPYAVFVSSPPTYLDLWPTYFNACLT